MLEAASSKKPSADANADESSAAPSKVLGWAGHVMI